MDARFPGAILVLKQKVPHPGYPLSPGQAESVGPPTLPSPRNQTLAWPGRSEATGERRPVLLKEGSIACRLSQSLSTSSSFLLRRPIILNPTPFRQSFRKTLQQDSDDTAYKANPHKNAKSRSYLDVVIFVAS